jgi:hypothetical protein
MRQQVRPDPQSALVRAGPEGVAQEVLQEGALEIGVVRDIGVGALELVEHLVKLRRESKVLVDQVMHGARLRRHGERRPDQSRSLVGDRTILEQIHRGDLDDRVDRRVGPGGFDVDHADGHMGSRVCATSGLGGQILRRRTSRPSSICDSRLGEQRTAV